MDNLANTLRALAKKPVNLAQVADTLEKCAIQGNFLSDSHIKLGIHTCYLSGYIH